MISSISKIIRRIIFNGAFIFILTARLAWKCFHRYRLLSISHPRSTSIPSISWYLSICLFVLILTISLASKFGFVHPLVFIFFFSSFISLLLYSVNRFVSEQTNERNTSSTWTHSSCIFSCSLSLSKSIRKGIPMALQNNTSHG